ncbi:MAG: PPOX class F420-dependent oxidoreductase [Solirubrobacterales bacterium]
MTVAERIADATSHLYDVIRSPKAREAAKQPAKGNLDSLNGHKYCLVTTFKRSGEPVGTPVWFGLVDGRLYFRSYADAVKLRRIANNPRVLVGPCGARGSPRGPMIEASARILPPADEERAEQAIKSNYGLFRRLYEASFSMRVEGTYVEVTPE